MWCFSKWQAVAMYVSCCNVWMPVAKAKKVNGNDLEFIKSSHIDSCKRH